MTRFPSKTYQAILEHSTRIHDVELRVLAVCLRRAWRRNLRGVQFLLGLDVPAMDSVELEVWKRAGRAVVQSTPGPAPTTYDQASAPTK